MLRTVATCFMGVAVMGNPNGGDVKLDGSVVPPPPPQQQGASAGAAAADGTEKAWKEENASAGAAKAKSQAKYAQFSVHAGDKATDPSPNEANNGYGMAPPKGAKKI